ncbi:TPA: hypothetical protein NI656_005499 [Pseudomonas aeruginosa]|uniref:hypothetical protein n=1 Tax=Pseudomonas aeruginosa TaxID=287 RepID=UPI00071B3774|nr:hypothetical protein [Pseudomonas aeruginosa]KSP83337.1 hypothetical protein APB20_16030 [Pseudomonas aeruginosa]WNZ20501.1 hypothetical protein QJQ47_12485 [Pseudomonas aeruginosa]HBN9790929.1 hypothetical protein [Pseudomonas aeruginosa]HCF9584621.1 hypothetical protein [Pseudomonas aeruginosa]
MKGLDKSPAQRRIEKLTDLDFTDVFDAAQQQADADALLRRCKNITGLMTTIGGQALSEDICEYFRKYGAQREAA